MTDGDSFHDGYLQYEYPGEALASPLPGRRLTYRILDAYFIVLMIRQAGVQPGGAQALFDRAETATASLVPLWRQQGIYNLRRHPVRGGVALDTYAILAVLQRDVAMGRVVAAGRDGDGWLAEDFYTGWDAFRRLADESWAARAMLVADPVAGREAILETCRRIAVSLRTERDPSARANLVIHALEALADLPAPEAGTGGDAAALLDVTRQDFREEALRLLETDTIRRDTLTSGNLVGVLARRPAVPGEVLAPRVAEIVGRQDGTGCWNATADPADTDARLFATLRTVLALGRYAAIPGGR